MANLKQAASDGGVLLERFVNAFVNLDKPLIGLINGPAVGISVTLLPLFDLVIASDRATFIAPFTKIAQSPEVGQQTRGQTCSLVNLNVLLLRLARRTHSRG